MQITYKLMPGNRPTPFLGERQLTEGDVVALLLDDGHGLSARVHFEAENTIWPILIIDITEGVTVRMAAGVCRAELEWLRPYDAPRQFDTWWKVVIGSDNPGFRVVCATCNHEQKMDRHPTEASSHCLRCAYRVTQRIAMVRRPPSEAPSW